VVEPNRYAQLPGQLSLTSASFPAYEPSGSSSGAAPQRPGGHTLPGLLINYNTAEAFKAMDAAAQLRLAAATVWADICSGAAEADPSRLATFWLHTYADLKRFRFTYWALLPALKPPAPFVCLSTATVHRALGEILSQQVHRGRCVRITTKQQH
jgi:ubiquitin-like modifier-activating enzyme ATG7